MFLSSPTVVQCYTTQFSGLNYLEGIGPQWDNQRRAVVWTRGRDTLCESRVQRAFSRGSGGGAGDGVKFLKVINVGFRGTNSLPDDGCGTRRKGAFVRPSLKMVKERRLTNWFRPIPFRRTWSAARSCDCLRLNVVDKRFDCFHISSMARLLLPQVL